MRHTTGGTVALLVLLYVTAAAGQTPQPLGAYLGCFDLAKLSTDPTKVSSKHVQQQDAACTQVWHAMARCMPKSGQPLWVVILSHIILSDTHCRMHAEVLASSLCLPHLSLVDNVACMPAGTWQP